MITREQVADLREGDVVELRDDRWPGVVVTGPVRYVANNAYPHVGPAVVWPHSVEHIAQSITVVSRAPRPLYVNHPRAEPLDHDVVRDGEGAIRHCDAEGFGGKPTWWAFEAIAGCKWTHTTFPPQPLTLLVDGENGQVVQ